MELGIRLRPLALVASVVLGGACTSPTNTDVATHDATLDGTSDGSLLCHSDTDCDDHVFCNGPERCMPSAPAANARGCIASPTGGPCAAPLVCVEAMAQCQINCPGGNPDADGDGHRSMACGGDDCDDADPHRFPGNPEVCVFMPVGTGAAHRPGGDHDEDCDPFTFQNAMTHDGDHDNDGYVDVFCSNTDSTGTVRRGDDCVDVDRQVGTVHAIRSTVDAGDIHPMQTEACNGVDDNCNGMTDESLLVELHRDNDDDGYGVDAIEDTACSLPSGYADRGGDCNDSNPAIRPGVAELCNAIDDDCNGIVDDNTESICSMLLGSHGPAGCFMNGTVAVCRPTGCAVGFSDCDGNPTNGCEADNCNDSTQCNHCGGTCPCSGGGCVGINPMLSMIGSVSVDTSGGGTGGPVAGATVSSMFGCHPESGTTDASGQFSITQTVTGSSLFRVEASGFRPHVASQFGYDLIPNSVVRGWFADPDAPTEDARRGIVVLEITGFSPVDWQVNAPAGARQIIDSGDVLAPGVGGNQAVSVWFNVAPGPVTVSAVIPVGCGATCSPGQSFRTWVLPGGITRIVIDSCNEFCA